MSDGCAFESRQPGEGLICSRKVSRPARGLTEGLQMCLRNTYQGTVSDSCAFESRQPGEGLICSRKVSRPARGLTEGLQMCLRNTYQGTVSDSCAFESRQPGEGLICSRKVSRPARDLTEGLQCMQWNCRSPCFAREEGIAIRSRGRCRSKPRWRRRNAGCGS